MTHIKALIPRVIAECCSGKLSISQAARACGYSKQQIINYKKRYLKEGDAAFISRHKFQVPVNKTPDVLRAEVVRIYRTDFDGECWTYFRDCLETDYNIKLSYTCIRNIMRAYGYVSPEAHKVKKDLKKLHPTRERKAHEGEMIQVDATPYDWFGDGKKYALHGAVDDATSKITGLWLTDNECAFGYYATYRMQDKLFGLHCSEYTDRSAIFCTSARNKQDLNITEQLAAVRKKKNQWQLMLDRIGVQQILAWSPQAKGRVERVWHTIQERLPHELKKRGIKTVDEANKYLPQFIADYNAKFAKKARSPISYWRVTYGLLDDNLCNIFSRKTNSAGEFSFHGYKFKLVTKYNVCCKSFDLHINEHGLWGIVDGERVEVQMIDDDYGFTVSDHMNNALDEIIYDYMFADSKKNCA